MEWNTFGSDDDIFTGCCFSAKFLSYSIQNVVFQAATCSTASFMCVWSKVCFKIVAQDKCHIYHKSFFYQNCKIPGEEKSRKSRFYQIIHRDRRTLTIHPPTVQDRLLIDSRRKCLEHKYVTNTLMMPLKVKKESFSRMPYHCFMNVSTFAITCFVTHNLFTTAIVCGKESFCSERLVTSPISILFFGQT